MIPKRPRWFVLGVALALLVSLLAVTPALAEDPPPPADPPPVEVVTEDALPPEAEAPPLDEPMSEPAPEAAPAVQPPEAVPPAEAQVPEAGAPTSEELLAEVPEGTTVAVVGEAGEVLPLASAEAAEVLATGDPVWCPTGVLPGGATCSGSFVNLAALVAGFTPGGNGVIWIEKTGDSSAVPVTIDGSSGSWSAAKTFALTLQGGWDIPTNTVITSDPSEFHVPLRILNWEADVTLNDIVITGAAGPSQALDISTTQKVTLNRVKVRGNGAGAHIDNDAGSADVVVTASEFSGATGGSNGLTLSSHGAITLAGVLANQNQGCGVCLTNEGAAAPKNVTLTSGVFEFNENALEGLVIYSKGAITLKDITATGNFDDGVRVNNSFPGAAAP